MPCSSARSEGISGPRLADAVTRVLCQDHRTHKWNEIDVDGNGCVSFPEFVDWARKQGVDLPLGIEEGVGSMEDIPPPPEWSGPRGDMSYNRTRDVTREAFVEIQEMIDASYRHVWTRDRRKTGKDAIPKRFELVKAMRNENHEDWRGYWLKRSQILKGPIANLHQNSNGRLIVLETL